jgi:2,4-dienoyl-CoA reductase-like NADH-dependent reductase (Old Yellow Enzyme family)
MADLASLFQPIDIHGLRLKNRLVMAPMHTDFATLDGDVTDRLITFLAGVERVWS